MLGGRHHLAEEAGRLVLGQGGDDTFLIGENDGSDTIVGGGLTSVGDVVDTSLVTGGVTVSFTATGSGSLSATGTTVNFSSIERVQTGIHISINGIAAGLRNTG